MATPTTKPTFKVPGGRRLIPLPDPVQEAMERAGTIEDIVQVLQDHEADIARACLNRSEFIDCDQMASLLSQWLRWRGIPHQSVLGKSDIGDSHAWVRIQGRNIDPTDQGFGDGSYEVIATYP